MIHEKSVGVIPFRRYGKKVKYLLLRYEAGHWDFPKGNVEKDEEELATAARELGEETGIVEAEFVEGFREKISFFYRGYETKELVKKEVVYYLAQTKSKEVEISWEHVGFEWLSYEQALERLTFKNSKEVLKKAHAFLSSRLTVFTG